MKTIINKIKEWWNFLSLRQEEEVEIEFECSTCEDTGIVVENAGYCGGCEICRGVEEREVPCPDCSLNDEYDETD